MNDKHYDPFSVDLYQLWQAGYKYIPRVADAYAECSKELGATEGYETTAFSRDGGSSAVAMKFVELREHVQIVMGRVSTNLYAVGEALVNVADAYAEADEDAAVGIDYADQKKASKKDDPGTVFDEYGQPVDLDEAPAVDGQDETLPDSKDREEQQARGESG